MAVTVVSHPAIAMTEERTLIILKPDALQRGLAGRILTRFEDKGFTLVALKLVRVSRELAERHYAEHKGKGFYDGLIRYITSSPVMVGVLEAPRAIKMARDLCGATFGFNAAPGTIRGDYSGSTGYNTIHASDSPAAATREISLYFQPAELLEWQPSRVAHSFNDEDAGKTSG